MDLCNEFVLELQTPGLMGPKLGLKLGIYSIWILELLRSINQNKDSYRKGSTHLASPVEHQ